MPDTPKLSVIGHERSHDTLLRVLGAQRPCKILDIPAGQGVLAAFLKEKGWDVHAADIDPGIFKMRDLPFTSVNLNRALPFDNASFDAIACVNGLHRLLFPEVAIREFFRILRPGGRLYINVNNYSSIWKRLRFLLSGSIDQMIDTQECWQTIDNPEAHVRLPLMYPRLSNILEQIGFEVIDVQPAAITTRDRLLMPLAILISAAGRLIPPSLRKEIRIAQGNHRSILAGGHYIFIEASRPPA